MPAEPRPGRVGQWFDALLDRLAGVPAEPRPGAPQRKAARAGAKAQRLVDDLDRLAARHSGPNEDAPESR